MSDAKSFDDAVSRGGMSRKRARLEESPAFEDSARLNHFMPAKKPSSEFMSALSIQQLKLNFDVQKTLMDASTDPAVKKRFLDQIVECGIGMHEMTMGLPVFASASASSQTSTPSVPSSSSSRQSPVFPLDLSTV
jgi:hypothetical protein